MNKRHVLLGLVAFVFLTTIVMVVLSGNMASLHVKAYRFLHPERGDLPSTLLTRGSTQLSTTRNRPSNPDTNATSVGKPNSTHGATPPPKKAPVTNRPLKCQHCFRPDLANLTAVPEVCAGSGNGSGNGSGGAAPPEMLMMITTTLDGLERRQAIRETWASVTKSNTAQHVRHVFLLGTDKAGKVSEAIREEAARYQDILVSNFVDVYGNLTYKTLSGMHYLLEHCAGAKYFLKTDQDMYVFVDHLLDLARRNAQTLQTSLGGSCYQTGKPWRNPKTKYYASLQSYPQSSYPGFCSGTGYLGSLNVARKIVELSPDVPFFHLEDVYLALVLRQAGYKLTKYQGFVEGAGVCASRGSSSRARNAMTIHERIPEDTSKAVPGGGPPKADVFFV